jgi:small-conductance mechanosensitive channel
MRQEHIDIIQFTLIFLLLLGAMIFAFFRLFKYLIQFMRIPVRQREFLLKYLPATELFAWVAFLMWASQLLYSRGQIISIVPLLIFTIIIILLGWFLLKELVAGIIFRINNRYKINDYIHISGLSGRLLSVGLQCLEIEDAQGRIIAIPYSKVAGNIVSRAYPSQSILSHNFVLKIGRGDEANIFNLIEKLRKTILTLPWSAQKKEPKIEIADESEDSIAFRITIYSLDEVYFKKTEKHLEEKFGATALK